MYREILSYIDAVKDLGDRIVVDCTMGEGGHSSMILERFPSVRLVSFERDPEIFAIGQKRLAPWGERVRCVNANFSGIKANLAGLEGKVSAILYDFGISSFHFDRSGRGFSYAGDEPLDMRLDPSCPFDAAHVVNTYPFEKLAHVIGTYGEERWAGRIARRICSERERAPITTAGRLAEIVLASQPGKYREERIHPATRTFQALRIETNDELGQIEKTLPLLIRLLKPGGRLAIISFHSLEDRIVKDFLKDQKNAGYEADLTVLTNHPIPGTEDVHNPRARSAKLRAAVKIKKERT